MKRVCKWNVPVNDDIALVGNGKVVHVAIQRVPDVIQVWTEESATDPKATRPVAVFGTGHSIPVSAQHIGSVVTMGGSLVWHVYEVRERQ